MTRLEKLLAEKERLEAERRAMACETCGRRYCILCHHYGWKRGCLRRVHYDAKYYPRPIKVRHESQETVGSA